MAVTDQHGASVMPRWWKVWMVAGGVLLAILSLPLRAHGQVSDYNEDSTVSVNGAIEIVDILAQGLDLKPDSFLVRRAWKWDLECTGLSPQPGSGLADVEWVVVPSGKLLVDNQGAFGYHFNSGLILLDERVYNDFFTIAHELMHQLLQGPPLWQGGYHPWAPFAFPCQLMTFQHVPGGIMNDRPPLVKK